MSDRLGGIISATANPLAGSPSTVEYLVIPSVVVLLYGLRIAVLNALKG